MDTTNNITESDNATNFYSPLFDMELSMPEWEAIVTIISLGTVIITTIIGKIQ